MFRRVEETLQADPTLPADLKTLGFFINKTDHIRMIKTPEKGYVFRVTENERYNEVRREAMQTCERMEVQKRLSALGIERLYLPNISSQKPNEPYVPILASPLELLRTRKRVIVLVDDSDRDPGILSYRQIQRDLGINGGSVINFLNQVIDRSVEHKSDEDTGLTLEMNTATTKTEHLINVPGVIIANTAQLLYSHRMNQALTLRSWSAQQRKSISHDAIRVHEKENHVDGHRNPREHIKSLFNTFICNPDRVAPDAEVHIIAIGDGVENVLSVLGEDFEKYGSRITAMAAVHTLLEDSQIHNQTLKAFLRQRTRQWRFSDLTSDPTHCTELPDGYVEEHESQGASTDSSSSSPKSSAHINWLEAIPNPSYVSTFKSAVHKLAQVMTCLKFNQKDSDQDTDMDDWGMNTSVICPTFGGGEEPGAECVSTSSNVQDAILSFFEEVAQDPENYRNPAFTLHAGAPAPTPDDPLTLSADTIQTDESLPAEMVLEQHELEHERLQLTDLRFALEACPSDNPELAEGMAYLEKKIVAKEDEVRELEKKALAKGSLKAGEAKEARAEDWEPQLEGPKVPFAGTMVDSELLKAAGLADTADNELEKLEKPEKP